ncbi:hypothetical protein PV327_011034 [Microctonus hyperodae]|nr:hypothetical protein PV327_011034 [Microctonus hyperodae]
MTCYNYTNDYALLSYLEYPVILIQEFVLIYLVMKYLNRINIMTISLALCYFIISICLIKQIIPNVFLTILASMCTPISALSKIVQLFAIIRAKNSESVSLLTWIISVFTNITRVYTIWVDSGDVVLLGNFIISVFLSSSIMFSVMYYKPHTKKE